MPRIGLPIIFGKSTLLLEIFIFDTPHKITILKSFVFILVNLYSLHT